MPYVYIFIVLYYAFAYSIMHLLTEKTFVRIRIETNGTDLEVKAGHDIFNMKASYQSYPDANISWYKDGEPIEPGDRHYLIR